MPARVLFDFTDHHLPDIIDLTEDDLRKQFLPTPPASMEMVRYPLLSTKLTSDTRIRFIEAMVGPT